MTAGAFYEQLDDHRWRATAATTGPWSPTHQHGGPPAALLGTVLAAALGDGRIVRLTFEILRPVPVAELTTSVEVVRPGRKVAMARAALATDDGPVMTVQGWRIREAPGLLEPDRPGGDPEVATIPGPDESELRPFFEVTWEGYHTSVQTRFVRGDDRGEGDAAAWLRCRVPLVAGTELTPLQRLLVAADTGNGISGRLPLADWLFVNPDLTVAVRELPAGEWVGLDARTRFGPDGIGLATATIHDEQHGAIGAALQSLIVEPR